MHEGMGNDKDIYSFPRDENGVIKIGFRKTKWTNYGDVAGKRISVPKAVYVKETNIPVPALEGIKGKVRQSCTSLGMGGRIS